MGPRELATWSGQARVVHVARSHLDDGRGVETGDNTNLPFSSTFSSPMAGPATKIAYVSLRIKVTGNERCRMCEGKAGEPCPAESTLPREEHAGHVSLSLAKGERASSARGARGARRCRGNARATRTRGTLETCSDGLVCVIYDGALFVSLGGHLIFCLSRASRARASPPKGAYASRGRLETRLAERLSLGVHPAAAVQ